MISRKGNHPIYWIVDAAAGTKAPSPVEASRQNNALAVADVDPVRVYAVGATSRKIVERIGLRSGRSASLRNAGALQCQSIDCSGVWAHCGGEAGFYLVLQVFLRLAITSLIASFGVERRELREVKRHLLLSRTDIGG